MSLVAALFLQTVFEEELDKVLNNEYMYILNKTIKLDYSFPISIHDTSFSVQIFFGLFCYSFLCTCYM